MRVYITTTEEEALEFVEKGFRDIGPSHDGHGQAVPCQSHPRGEIVAAASVGVMFSGRGIYEPVVMCTDIPDDVWQEWEEQESTQAITEEQRRMIEEGHGPNLEFVRMGIAFIPSEILNIYGKPRIYSHFYTDFSRPELLKAAAMWGDGHKKANEILSAIAFLDKIGWRTPLILSQPTDADDPHAPPPFFRGANEE